MTLNDWLTITTKTLASHGIASARLDALVLLEDQLGKDRAWVLAHPEHELADSDKNVLDDLVALRARHIPLAQLRGHSEFYARDFIITADVLQPRPESEAMIEALKKIVHDISDPLGGAASKSGASYIAYTKRIDNVLHGGKDVRSLEAANEVQTISIADVGAGSGALGITAALELKNVSVDLLEISDAAIEIAKRNVIKHTTGISVVRSDLLAQAPRSYDILLCNLPYVPDDYEINTAATHEPSIALFGGPDGLDLYRQLFSQIKKIKNKPLYILTEALPAQHGALQAIAYEHGYSLQTTDDFIQVFVTTL